MSEQIESGALKVIELVGISQESFDDAVQQAVRRASAKLENITGVEVTKFTAKVNENKITEFHSAVKLAFVVTDKR